MISVIIPTLNERQVIRACIESVLSGRHNGEVVVSDGGSADGTPGVVREYAGRNVLLVEGGKGRGTQMNAGASVAHGDVFLFLHADTRLDKGWDDAVTAAMKDAGTAAGAFSLRIDSDRRHFRLIEAWVRFRCRLFSLPYGDQAIFVRRRTFLDIGGYREIPLMEDVDLIARLKATGRIVVRQEKVFTSARRWEREGWLFTSARNPLIMLLYRLGVDPKRLARMYCR